MSHTDDEDTHIHAPQYPNCGIFGSSTLLDWLQTYTFPLEKSFGVPHSTILPSTVAPSYDQVIARTLSHGTTCASYFATIHVPATNYLASACYNRGQRALIGRCCMDREKTCPADYRDSSLEETITATKATISHIQTVDPTGTLINPIITPRFAPSCTEQSLAGLGILAASHDPPLHIQTHISENKDEVSLVKDLYPTSKNYTDVYDTAKLLTPRTILAHGIYLSPSERAVIRARQSKIAHCPTSNSSLGSGLCPVRALLDAGITVGLGTDVSGGFHPSVLEAVRQAYIVSRLLTHTKASENEHFRPDGSEIISIEEGLYLATRGGAAVVDMADDIGGFDVDMFFDAQLIQLGQVRSGPPPPSSSSSNTTSSVLHQLDKYRDSGPVSNVDIFGWESWSEKVQKWVWNGDDRNVSMVWVMGRLVHDRDGGNKAVDHPGRRISVYLAVAFGLGLFVCMIMSR